MRKKRMIAVIAIVALIIIAMGFPLAINYYNDNKLVNKVQYVESKEIDIISIDDEQSVASKLNTLNKYLDSDAMTGVIGLNFEPSYEKKIDIYEKIGQEIEQWFREDIMSLETFGISPKWVSEYVIEDVALCSIGNVSFFEVVLGIVGDPYTAMVVNIDSDCYKIYSVEIYGGTVKEMQNLYHYNFKITNMEVVFKQMADNISQYYEIDVPEIKKSSYEDKNEISYGLLSNLEWNISYYKNGDEVAAHIGIPSLY